MTSPSRESAIQARDKLARAHSMSASREDSVSLYSQGRDAIAYLLAENEKLRARIDRALKCYGPDESLAVGVPRYKSADEFLIAIRAALTDEGTE